jgi:hypothetical protein
MLVFNGKGGNGRVTVYGRAPQTTSLDGDLQRTWLGTWTLVKCTFSCLSGWVVHSWGSLVMDLAEGPVGLGWG